MACSSSHNNNHSSAEELESALQELGLTTTVSNSRREYLAERAASQPKVVFIDFSHHIHLIEFNPAFVSQLSLLAPSITPETSVANRISISRPTRCSYPCRRLSSIRCSRLYEAPYKKPPVKMDTMPPPLSDVLLSSPVASSSRACFSNTNTPEKSGLTIETTVQRSRSLDELEFSRLSLSTEKTCHKEVESMSQHFDRLQV